MIWFIMIATGLFTFATRFIMLSNGINNRPPPWLVDALGFVPIAAVSYTHLTLPTNREV